MRLKRLEIYGFKSFPQRTEIVFNQGITGIVGPNGSGKSNIGDAVRWVLGEQSARTLRGAKMEDVIFGGTQKRKSMAFCEVTLAFDNEDGSLPLPFAEVAVTRRVFRTGESEYMINQAPCRLKDMIDLFRDTGIGREGYSLIGQGRIDEILSLKSEDRRQVFEEAAGISRYRARKAEAERSLDRTRDNLARADDIIKEIEDRLEPLGKQADQAREYLELTDELKTLDLNLFLIGYERISQRIAGLKAASGEAQDAMLRVEAAIRERVRERDESAETAAKLDTEAENARAALAEAQTRLADAQSTRERLSERVTGADEQKTRLSAELDAALADVAQREQASGSDQHLLTECLERVAEAEQTLAEAERVLQDAIDNADALSAELDSHREGMLRAVNRLSDLNAARARSETMLTQIAARQDEFTRTLSDLEKGRAAFKDAFEFAQEALENTQAQAASFSTAVEEAQKHVKSLDEKARAHSEALQNKNAKLRGDESRLRLLSEMAASLEGYNQSVRRALSYSEHNPRVRGVLARLIRVPKQYEIAIDVALGGALQNIVTDDQETAKDLFEYLRQNRLGRVTCLPISAIRGRGLTQQERRLLSMPGCLGVASELIQYGDEYSDIIESLLGRTVVARTLNEGIPIMNAGGRAFRLVTLEGDVMHSGGSMTGGGSGQSRAASLLGRERETEELRVSVDAQRAELLEGQKTLQELMQAREQAANTLDRAQKDKHEEDIAVARDTAALERTQDALKKHDEQIDMTKSALEQLSDSMSTIHAELEKLSRSSDDTALDRQVMEEKTQQLTRALSEKRMEADAKRDDVTRATLALGECQHTAQDQTRAAQKLLKEQEAARTHADALREELRLHDERTEMAVRALEETTLAVHDHEAARAQADDHVREVENQRREAQKKNTDCTQAIEALHTESATHSDHQHRLQLSLSRAENDLESQCAYIHNTYLLTYADALPYRTQEKFDVAPSERRAGELRSRIRALGSVNVSAMEEYAATKARYDDMISQREDMRKAEGDLEQLIHRLLSRMEKQFTEQFEILGKFFVETFTRLFGGGQAELKLADPDHALDCGIDIVAQPPGKKLQMLSLLSGGERALTAIAILFAMLKLKPTPFCILDEIEAALDEANITYFADYLAEYAKTTQFVVVTHRKGTMERCDALYGVAMQEQGVSGMVSVDLRDYE